MKTRKLHNRIKAAASKHDVSYLVARSILESIFPELFGPNPTMWLAPMEATEGMLRSTVTSMGSKRNWREFRDAFLKAEEGK